MTISDSAGWPLVSLSTVTLDVPNCDPAKAPDAAFTYIDISSVDNKRCEITEPKYLTGSAAPSRARRPVQEGDVLFSNVRTYLRNVALVTDTHGVTIASTGFTVLRPTVRILPRYLYHLVRSDYFIDQVTPEQTGSHYPATSDRVIRGQRVPLPDVPTQEALVTLIDAAEEVRSTAEAHVVRAGSAIAACRQAVIESACFGQLTVDWRTEHPDSQPIDLAGARQRRKAEMKQRFREPSPNAHAEITELPEGWVTSPLGIVLREVKYGTSTRSEYGVAGTPVLRIPNVSGDKLDTGDMKYAALDVATAKSLRLEIDDLLMIRSNGSVQLVGKALKVTDAAVGMGYAGYLMRLRADPDAIDPSYLELVLATGELRRQIEMPARSTSGVHNINTEEVRGLVVPIPPLAEQHEIVSRAVPLLEMARALESHVSVARTQVQRSAQSLLTQLFEGDDPMTPAPPSSPHGATSP